MNEYVRLCNTNIKKKTQLVISTFLGPGEMGDRPVGEIGKSAL